MPRGQRDGSLRPYVRPNFKNIHYVLCSLREIVFRNSFVLVSVLTAVFMFLSVRISSVGNGGYAPYAGMKATVACNVLKDLDWEFQALYDKNVLICGAVEFSCCRAPCTHEVGTSRAMSAVASKYHTCL
jgi:hypothetical protein